MDEKTPYLYATLVLIVTGERKSHINYKLTQQYFDHLFISTMYCILHPCY